MVTICAHYMELDLRIEAARSYNDFKKRYKRVYGVTPPARSKATKVAVAAEEAEAPAAEEEMPPPPLLGRGRRDVMLGKPAITFPRCASIRMLVLAYAN